MVCRIEEKEKIIGILGTDGGDRIFGFFGTHLVGTGVFNDIIIKGIKSLYCILLLQYYSIKDKQVWDLSEDEH